MVDSRMAAATKRGSACLVRALFLAKTFSRVQHLRRKRFLWEANHSGGDTAVACLFWEGVATVSSYILLV